MLMYNLIECNKKYRKATGILCNYYRDEPAIPHDDNYNADLKRNSGSFKYKNSIIGKTLNNNNDNE